MQRVCATSCFSKNGDCLAPSIHIHLPICPRGKYHLCNSWLESGKCRVHMEYMVMGLYSLLFSLKDWDLQMQKIPNIFWSWKCNSHFSSLLFLFPWCYVDTELCRGVQLCWVRKESQCSEFLSVEEWTRPDLDLKLKWSTGQRVLS